MELNGVIREGVTLPAPVVRARSPVPHSVEGEPPGVPPVREASAPRIEQPATIAPEVLVEQRSAKTRAGTRLRLDDATNRVIAQIVNTNNEVIRQIPPEAALKIAARFRNVVGLLFDRQI